MYTYTLNPLFYPQDEAKLIKQLEKLKTSNITSLLKGKKTIKYYNILASFDIETTSYYKEDEKDPLYFGFMYSWMIGINGQAYIGRTYNDLQKVFRLISDVLELSDEKRLLFTDHNLEFEFQFIRKYFNFSDVFITKGRNVISAYIDNLGIEFKDTLIYTAKGLAKVAEDLLKYTIQKKTGDLDYSLIHLPITPLTKEEIGYMVNDVIILNNYQQEEIEKNGWEYFLKVKTNTGKVREAVKEHCFIIDTNNGMLFNHNYDNYIHSLNLDYDVYKLLSYSFSGGFTHASHYKSGLTLKNVDSIDLTSAYPSVIVGKKYPCNNFTLLSQANIDMIEKLIEDGKALLMDLTYYNLDDKVEYEHIISKSKLLNLKDLMDGKVEYQEDNGRIINCTEARLVITELDYNMIKKFYDYDRVEINTVYFCNKSYLPKEIIEAVLFYYNNKTQYKGVKGKEADYMISKGMLNSIYGMMVQSIINDLNEYKEGDFNTKAYSIDRTEDEEDIKKAIKQYNRKKDRFLYYAWGVWITAYVRERIETMILKLGMDYIYADTDSNKLLNIENHLDDIEKTNEEITKEIKEALEFHNIPYELAEPTDKNGIKHPLGIFDWETKDGNYKRFKTLGAKRYIVEEYNKKINKNELHITIAGLGKKSGAYYLSHLKAEYEMENGDTDYIFNETEENLDNAFNAFNNGLEIPADHTGKLTHHYIDDEITLKLKDYLGNMQTITAKSGICLTPCKFNMHLTESYINLIMNNQTWEDGDAITKL